MRHAHFAVTLLSALVISAAVLMPSTARVLGVTVVSAAQDAAAVEAALGLDRPTRRLIQQGLRNEGFDPGAPDGLFGPRTRRAIRHWQEAWGAVATGYLDGEQAELLSASGASAPSGSERVEPRLAPVEVGTGSAPQDSVAETAVALVAGESGRLEQAGTDGGGNRPAPQAGNVRQLPPEILVDRHLVRIERLLADEAYDAARDVLNEINALQQAHNLALEEEFHFTYARLAFVAGLHETAIDAVNDYLLAAGRDGEFYRDALELLDSAEVALRLAETERRRAEAERQRIEEARRRERARRQENYDLARRQIDLAATALPRDELRSGGLGPEMVSIASGRFQFATSYQSTWQGAEPYLEWAIIDRPFAISKYEVTRRAFERFVDSSRYRTAAERGSTCGYRNSSWKRPRAAGLYLSEPPRIDQTDAHPVVCVSHRDAMAYASWLSQQTGQSYRLPSPAEWQYAARAGSNAAMFHMAFTRGEHCGRVNLDEHNCTDTDGVLYTAAVGRFAPNGVGVHDMIGNVAELVLGCRQDTGDYRGLARDGSPDGIDGCERPAAMGGGYYSAGTRGDFINYRTADFLYEFNDKANRAGESYVGIRLVRDLHE